MKTMNGRMKRLRGAQAQEREREREREEQRDRQSGRERRGENVKQNEPDTTPTTY